MFHKPVREFALVCSACHKRMSDKECWDHHKKKSEEVWEQAKAFFGPIVPLVGEKLPIEYHRYVAQRGQESLLGKTEAVLESVPLPFQVCANTNWTLSVRFVFDRKLPCLIEGEYPHISNKLNPEMGVTIEDGVVRVFWGGRYSSRTQVEPFFEHHDAEKWYKSVKQS